MNASMTVYGRFFYPAGAACDARSAVQGKKDTGDNSGTRATPHNTPKLGGRPQRRRADSDTSGGNVRWCVWRKDDSLQYELMITAHHATKRRARGVLDFTPDVAPTSFTAVGGALGMS